MLELHIWGPAFSLPSIDPQCIATIAYLNLVLQKDEWSVIASSNPLLSPTRQLPALCDGRTWTAGFRGIVEYIRKKTNGQADLDADLSDVEKAECTAFSAFVETHGQTLLDLSIYVSRKNFDSVTRSVYATLLPFPMQYYTPVALRSQSKQRTLPLGITALDIDTAPPPPPPPAGAPHTANPSPSPLLSAELTVPFKLAAIIADFLTPLQTRLGNNRYFFGSGPSTLDCLVVGYLSLCFYPELPHPWLAAEMKSRFGRICGYLNDLRTPFLGNFVDAGEILSFTRGDSGRPVSEIPWGVVERGDLPWMSRFVAERVLDAVGWGSEAQRRKKRAQELEEAMDPEDLERRRKMQAAVRSQRIRGALTVAGGVAAFIGYCIWSGLVQVRVRNKKGEDEYDDDDEEEEESEEDEENKEEDREEPKEPNEPEPRIDNLGLAGAVLFGRPIDINFNKEKDDLTAEEEDEIAQDIQAEEKEADEAIAKDVEDHIEGKE